jgi:hypothetical protein
MTKRAEKVRIKEAFYKIYKEFSVENVKLFTDNLNKISGNEWSFRYIYSILKYDHFPSTEKIEFAASDLLLEHEYGGVSHPVIDVRAIVHLPPGTIIIANAVACSGPDCYTIFIPPYASQKYCSKVCKQKARNLRRQQKRKEK